MTAKPHTTPNPALRGYALCTAPRSGSNLVCELLASTGALGYPLEYFNTEARRLLTDPQYPDDPAAQAQYILTRGASQNGVYGVKVFPWLHDRVSSRLRWSEALPNLRFVHLQRRDLLGQALSRLRAEQTQQWRSTIAARGVAHYDGRGILSCLNSIVRDQARWEMFFARNGIEPLRLVYEDVVTSAQEAADRVADLMHLERHPAVDPSFVSVRPQRDALTAEWRERFFAEFGDIDYIDVIEPEHPSARRGPLPSALTASTAEYGR